MPTGKSGRLVRAHRNLFESLPLFIGAIVVVHGADSVSTMAVVGSWTFFAARVAYIFAYVSAIPWLRPICWQVAFCGVIAILVDAVMI